MRSTTDRPLTCLPVFSITSALLNRFPPCLFLRLSHTHSLQFITQGVNLALIVFSALMIWKGLMVVTGSESPVVVVLRYVGKEKEEKAEAEGKDGRRRRRLK